MFCHRCPLFKCLLNQGGSHSNESHRLLSQREPESDPYSPRSISCGSRQQLSTGLGVRVTNRNAKSTHVPQLPTKPELECFIVPSYGSRPPSNVAVKKKVASDFLKGVREDSHVIQELINEDSKTTLCYVQLMCHFQQMKVAIFMQKIEDKMKRLKLKDPKKGLLIWYTGHGEKETGNWVFEDGCLKFEDIYGLYKKYFKARHLYIVTDCCYSGAWVVECARLLDNDGITCGHGAKREEVYIKVFASCLPNQSAYDKFYTKCNGVKLYSHDDRSKSIKFAEHRKLHRSTDQTTLGVDFTNDNFCFSDQHGRCIHRSTWTEHVQHLLGKDNSDHYLI